MGHAETFDAATALGAGPAIRCFCYSNFLIALASCMMGQVGQDRLREYFHYPKTTLLFSGVFPLVCTGMILVPQFINRWKHDQIEKQFMTMAGIITFSAF